MPAQDRARTYLMMRLVDALDLPDDKALALRAIFRKADERRIELVAKRQSIDKELRAALSRPDKDQAQLAKLVEEASTVDRDLASVAEDSFRDAQKDLTVEQQAKLVLLRRELQGQVREAVRRRKVVGDSGYRARGDRKSEMKRPLTNEPDTGRTFTFLKIFKTSHSRELGRRFERADTFSFHPSGKKSVRVGNLAEEGRGLLPLAIRIDV